MMIGAALLGLAAMVSGNGGRRTAVEDDPSGGGVERRAPGDGIRRGLHAGTVSGSWCAGGARAAGRLSIRERLESGERRSRGGGSSASPNTAGTQFGKQGAVLVAANYRLGRFGLSRFPC